MLGRQAVVGREDLRRRLLGKVSSHVVRDGGAAGDQAAAKGVDDGPLQRGRVALALLHGERHEACDVELGPVSCVCDRVTLGLLD